MASTTKLVAEVDEALSILRCAACGLLLAELTWAGQDGIEGEKDPVHLRGSLAGGSEGVRSDLSISLAPGWRMPNADDLDGGAPMPPIERRVWRPTNRVRKKWEHDIEIASRQREAYRRNPGAAEAARRRLKARAAFGERRGGSRLMSFSWFRQNPYGKPHVSFLRSGRTAHAGEAIECLCRRVNLIDPALDERVRERQRVLVSDVVADDNTSCAVAKGVIDSPPIE
jgi:hypothetical protein